MTIDKIRPTFAFTEDRLAELKAVVPEAFPDGALDWDTLREALGAFLPAGDAPAEHFGLNWPGKRDARRLAAKPFHDALHPAFGEGVAEDKTHNLYLEGDNLKIIKLLEKSYAGRVKMIYIDPPYNTGNDLVYKDDFTETLAEFLRRSGQASAGGDLLTSNPKSSGRFHTNWLNMMYPRLRIARSLLRDDGVIFISIDDNEYHHLRCLMDEIFGEENFLGSVVRGTGQTTGQDSGGFGTSFDYALVYSKTEMYILGGVALSDKDVARFSDEDERGKYDYWQLRKTGNNDRREDRPKMYFPVEAPDGTPILPTGPTGYDSCWRVGPETYKLLVQEGMIIWKETNRQGTRTWWPYVKYYLEGRTKRPSALWGDIDGSKKATADLRNLFGEKVFSNPKPVAFLERALQIGLSEDTDAIVLDFFSGSATTAHAIIELNREDGGNRKFILAQMPEPTPLNSAAYKAGYSNIAEIGKERIRRVIAQMKAQPLLELRDTPEDLGFKVFKLGSSTFKAWNDYEGDDLNALQNLFDEFETPLVPDWKPADLLAEVLLMEGFPLDSRVEAQAQFTENVIARIVSPFGGHCLWICFDAAIQSETLNALALPPGDVFVCLDAALNDDTKIQLIQAGSLKTI